MDATAQLELAPGCGNDGGGLADHVSLHAVHGVYPSEADCQINALLRGWHEGDSNAGDQLFRLYSDRVTNVVRFYLNPRFRTRVGIDDVVQTIFLTLLTKAKNQLLSFQGDASFGHWLRNFAKNIVRKRIQHEQAKKRDVARDCQAKSGVDLDAISCQECSLHNQPAELCEFKEMVHNAMERLDSLQQQIVQLARDGYSQVEIAEQLRLSTRTIRRRTLKIRECFADLVVAK